VRHLILSALLSAASLSSAAAQQPAAAAPDMQNESEVDRLLAEGMPRHIRSAAAGVPVVVRMLVSDSGSVDSVHVHITSGFMTLDNVARRAARRARFSPRSAPGAREWTDLPLEFPGVSRGAAGRTWAASAVNRDEAAARLQAFYPSALSDARISERVEVFLSVARDGRVSEAEVARTSCFPEVDDLALDVTRELTFDTAGAGPLGRNVLITASFSRDTARLRMTGDTVPPPRARERIAEPEGSGPTRRPELRNRSAVTSTLQRMYPRHLRNAGIGGTPVVWLYVSETGEILEIQLFRSGGLCEIDRTALDVARTMQFRPALSEGTPVAVWVEVPLTFDARRR
jgi:TonB family protein